MRIARREFLAIAAAGAATTELHRLTLAEAGNLVRRRKVSPVELTRHSLARIEKLNPSLNAFITLTADAALAQARELEREQMRGRLRGPLHGIPIALKDLYDTAGVRTTAASAHFRDRIPQQDATVVQSLRRAGAVSLGKLNMDEFAFNFTSETSHFGPVQNPWKRGYTPGGSSGASAAAVAAGLCYGALGSDTGGSIRLPAAFCAIAGFKPTFGRVPTEGVLPLAWSLDHAGPMCRTVADARLLLAGMGLTPSPERRGLKSVRIGVPRSPYFDKIDPEVETAIAKALGVLARMTAGVRDVSLPQLPADPAMPVLPRTYATVIMAEAYAYHEERLKKAPEKFHRGTRANLELGAAVPASAYVLARREMDRLRASSGDLFSAADLLVMPTAPGPAFPLGSRADLIYLRNLAPWNLYGLPAISAPCGVTRSGLPVGLQIVGPAGADALVLAVAEAYQAGTDPLPEAPAG
jgi:aspartyl-tRNA(Asn)/glutamyl-tRNA(Gln) amidotransferase subunit A